MLFKKIKNKPALILAFISITYVLFSGSSSANILDSWQDADAYKPNPILFLHGFAQGSPESWNNVADSLNRYFDDYTQVSTNLDLSRPYLERLAFNDPNGSIDTYPDGNDGWADKINYRVSLLSDTYRFRESFLKVNIVSHSMGGLAAREYLTNSRYMPILDIDKIVTIGTPHAGTPLANIREEVVSGVHKYIIEYPPFERAQFSLTIENTNDLTGLLRGEFRVDINGEAVRDMAIASQFLMNLNGSGSSPTNVKKFAIFGWVDDPVNWVFFPYYIGKENINFLRLGDLIVPVDSQKGYDVMTNYPEEYWVWQPDGITDINANHFKELESEHIVNKLLSFLDSTAPELEITYPDPGEITEILQSSIHIQGKVYREYLPADSKLHLLVVGEDDGTIILDEDRLNSIKPSDLWIPNDPDSPVAEFDEVVTFPGRGTYRISCQVKNPANESSEIIDVRVRVLYEGTNIIVHCHNPEGKEINSISTAIVDPIWWWQVDAEIYDGDIHIGGGAYRIEDHNRPIPIDPGSHTIKAVFNGMTLQQDIDISEGETKILTFTFERTEFDIAAWLDTFDDGDNTFERSGEGYIEWPDEFHEELTEELSSGSIVISKVNIDTSGFFPNGGHDYSYHNRIIQTFNSTTYKNETYAQLTISGEELPNRSYSSVWVDNRRSHPIDLPTNISFTYWFSQYKENYRYPKISLVSGDIEYPIIWNRYNFDPPYLTGHEVWMVPANRNYTSATWWGWGAFAMAFQNTEVEETYAYTLTDIKMSSVPYDLEEAGF